MTLAPRPAADREIIAFPPDFYWGTATASHQVEGGNENNDWWAWEQIPGRIKNGTRSGLAADWWHRAERDLDRAAEWGQNSHRLSLEWSRLQPGKDNWDEQATARYRQILGHMRAVGLEPMITLYHFTLPLWLYERGGWERPQAATHFVRYVERAVGAFGDLCRFWCTINEPMVYLSMGYIYGTWPPGCGSLSAARDVFRNLVAAHAGAYEVIHREQTDAQVGYAKHLRIFEPADPERWLDRKLVGWMDHLFNESALVGFADGTLLFPFGWPGRTGQAAAGPELLDFIGLNYYARDKVAFDRHRQDEMFIRFANDPAITPAGMGHAGEIYPHGLYRALVRVAGYDLPIYVTEFGLPDSDDSLRSRFIVEHVAAMGRALAEGVPLRGAYFWSLVDNFEWAEGWSARFGLMALDPQTQERTPRPSARVYRRIAKANGLERSLVGEIAPDLVAELFDPRATSREARNSQ